MAVILIGGQRHVFPDDATQEEIAAALQQWEVDSGQEIPREAPRGPSPGLQQLMSTVAPKVDTGGLGFDSLLSVGSKDFEEFRSKIQTIETGGLTNAWIRTQVYGSQSTAYGPYQITRGLLRGYLENHRDMFTDDEVSAIEELIARQSAAIAIGGRDRHHYEAGGSREVEGKIWAKAFGYSDTSTFLDAFDYGGDYGLSDDTEWQLQYENFARKMLQDHYKRNGKDGAKAAGEWHGGAGWEGKKHAKTTRGYIQKYQGLTDEGIKPTPSVAKPKQVAQVQPTQRGAPMQTEELERTRKLMEEGQRQQEAIENAPDIEAVVEGTRETQQF